MTSTTISTREDRTSSMFSVQCTEDGSQSTFFRATLRLRMCVRRRWVFERSQRIFATELPTVPKPIKATLQLWTPSFSAPVTALFLAESSLEAPGIPSPRFGLWHCRVGSAVLASPQAFFTVAFYYR